MSRSLRLNQNFVGTVKLALKRQGFLSQRALSEDLGLALSTVSNFLNGKPIDRAIFEEICLKLALDWKEIADLAKEPLRSIEDLSPQNSVTAITPLHQDWGEAPDSIKFYGRTNELDLLAQWIVQDQCRLVLILGMGGTGKTALSVKLLEQIGDRFDAFVWRSLRNAPPLQTLLNDLILSLSNQQAALSDRLESQLSKLIELLHQRRCLLVLDNAESILQSGEIGRYREGYEAYDELFCRVADGRHHSSLILTSREQPRNLAARIGNNLPIRLLCLNGLPLIEGQQLLTARGLINSEQSFQQLVQTYSGNPLAIKIAAATIASTFSGSIHEFLQQEVVTYGGIWDLLNQQFDRLCPLEQQVMYWLAIEREWIAFADLQQNWIPAIAQRQLVEALESLQGRSLIETSKLGFTQQPVVMEYVTQRLIDCCHQEIATQTLHLLRNHALLKAQTQDYIRNTQIRLILQPLAQKLMTLFNGEASVGFVFDQLLNTLRGKPLSYTGYAAGNLINLLNTLQADNSESAKPMLHDRDFSELAIAQAYLTEATLHRANFTDSTLHQSVFAETLGGIIAVAFSPDGKLLAASDTHGEVHVWRIVDRKKLLTLSGNYGWVFSLVFSPNSTTLASASTDFIVKLWDISNGACLQALRGPANLLNAVTFSPDERKILTDEGSVIQLWNVDCLEVQTTKLKGHTYLVRSIAVSPDRKSIANSTQDQTIRFWNLQTGDCERILHTSDSTVRLVAYSPDGRYLASTSLDPAIQIWDLQTNQCLYRLEGHSDGISEITFSPDGCYLASSSYDQTVKLWELSTGQCLKTLHGHSKKLMAVAFSADGKQLASGGDDHVVKLWDLHTGQCIKTFQGHTNAVSSIALSPDQQTLASAHEDLTIKLWNLQTGEMIKTLSGHTETIWSIAFAPSGHALISGSSDRTIKLWNLQTNACSTSLGHRNWVWSVAFHPQGHLFASGNYDETIKIWNTQTGECLQTLTEHTSAILCVCFSPDGNYLASSSFDQTVRIWEVSTGSCVRILRGHSDRIWQVVFSPNGQQIASCSYDQTIKLWNVKTGTCLNTLTGHQGALTSIAFSPDNQKLVSGGLDQTIKIWDVNTGQCLRTLNEHKGGILSILFESIDYFKDEVFDQSDRSDRIISSSLDGTIKFWHPDGKCLKTLRPPRPYEGMKISRLTGLTEAQRSTLKVLGAIEQ